MMNKSHLIGLLLGGPTLLTGCFQTDSCVARGVLVNTPSGRRPIEELRVGDEVFSYDEATGEPVIGRILAIQQATRECMSLRLPDGRHLWLTSDHPVYSPQRLTYVEAGQWATGELTLVNLVDDALGLTAVEIEVDLFVGVHDVFDISLDTPQHNFAANGVLVHNKQVPMGLPACLDGEATVIELDSCHCPEAPRQGVIRCLADTAICLCSETPAWQSAETGFATAPVPCQGDCCPEGTFPVIGEAVDTNATCHHGSTEYTVGCVVGWDWNTDAPADPRTDGAGCYHLPDSGFTVLTDHVLSWPSLDGAIHRFARCDDERHDQARALQSDGDACDEE